HDQLSEPLWRWQELCAALGLPVVAGPDVSGVSIDSRSIRPGELFVALPGDPGPRFNPSHRSDRDGHDFVDSALAAGAAGVLTHDGMQRACPELKVADTLDGLWALGRAARARLDCPVVAITGSSGKTTAKTLLSAALGAFSTPGSLNNHLGVPLSLARTPRDASAAVYEVGTNHPGEIGPLSELVRPTVAVLLNVQQAHRANFASMDDLRIEKISIINGLTESSVFVVEDQVALPASVAARCVLLRFGGSAEADVRLIDMVGDRARLSVRGRVVTGHVPGGGRHRALSLAAVIAVLVALGRQPEPALSLSTDLVPAGRGNRVDAGGVTIIDDSYNANPASMAGALDTLQQEAGRRFALLGEMLELGEAGEAAHRSLAEHCRGLDGVWCVGPGMMSLAEALGGSAQYHALPDDGLLESLANTLRQGDTLLVKGSNRVFWARDFVARIRSSLTS
ncbi:MAG TPA: UDP-N-acetylmuramoyl-tripeptide--D-alanyl-D-alanine ligase, partial [Pseudomonadales bacterium]